MLCDVDDISREYKRVAVEYWRSGELKTRTINSVKSRFRKISTRQLQQWEKQINIGSSRKEKRVETNFNIHIRQIYRSHS